MPDTTPTEQVQPEHPQTTARANRVEEVRTSIAAVAAAATDADRTIVNTIVSAADRGVYGAETMDITPGAAALLFINHNSHNRDWDPPWSLELARRQRAGLWRKNNEPPGFYLDGKLADAQHRLAACALSGTTWTTVIIFGLDRDAITTVDNGRRRDAASSLKMDGMSAAKLKQTVVKSAAAYLTKIGHEDAALRSEMEIASAISRNNLTLEMAIAMAEASEANLVNPVLKTPIATTIAYLMLTHGWPEQRVREKLALFQTGQSSVGEQEPFFIAGEIIQRSHDRSSNRDKLSTAKEIGLVIHTMRLSAQGVRATRKAALLAAIRNELPQLDYPGDEAPIAEAAE